MAKVVDPQNFAAASVPIPGLKDPVWDFAPTDDADPSEVDAFNRMIRDLRDQDGAVRSDNR
jgi:hypothetical protein